MICREGHHVAPLPGNVRRGRGPCRFCAGKTWDVFYVMVSDQLSRVKFGITSGDPRSRMGDHKRRGYLRTILLEKGINAQPVERAVIVALADAGYQPVEGVEYFDLDALDFILEIASAAIAGSVISEEAAQFVQDTLFGEGWEAA